MFCHAHMAATSQETSKQASNQETSKSCATKKQASLEQSRNRQVLSNQEPSKSRETKEQASLEQARDKPALSCAIVAVQVTGIAVSDRHPYMFSCGLDKQVKCWDMEYNKVLPQSAIVLIRPFKQAEIVLSSHSHTPYKVCQRQQKLPSMCMCTQCWQHQVLLCLLHHHWLELILHGNPSSILHWTPSCTGSHPAEDLILHPILQLCHAMPAHCHWLDIALHSTLWPKPCQALHSRNR